MIVRTWKGVVPSAKKQAYIDYVKNTGIDGYKNTPGNHGFFMFTREFDGKTEFTTMSFWDNVESIKKFAGNDFEKAVYYPDDDLFLIEKSEFVEHADVVYGKSETFEIDQ